MWSNHLGSVAEMVGTRHLSPLLLPHHPALLPDLGRGVHRGCPGDRWQKQQQMQIIFQVSRKQLTLPSTLSRLALVIVHSLGPAILASSLRRLEKKLSDPNLEISTNARQTFLRILPILQTIASGLEKLHTCIFYLQVILLIMTHNISTFSRGERYPN